MATYIPGVTDYIPQVQAFKPDMQSIDYYLRTKTQQYDQGYNKLNSIYSTLLNSPMLRQSDITRRDEFFKQAQMEIQKMSEQDLSLPQNIRSAQSVFQPLIDDPNISSDMVKTGKLQSAQAMGQSLRNIIPTKDNKGGPQGWAEGDEALGYWAQEYSQTDDQEALTFEDPKYTPYYDVHERAMGLIKELAPDVVSMGVTKDGNFIFKNKNGSALAGPVANYLVGAIGSDPHVAEMYNTKAYVHYMREVNQMSQLFGGDNKAAEDRLQNEMFPKLSQQLDSQLKNLNNTGQVINARKNIHGDKINNAGGVKSTNALVQQFLDFEAQEQIINQATDATKIAASNIDRSAMLTSDRKNKRQRILGAYAEDLLNQDMGRAAYIYAMTHHENTIEVNPYQKAYYDYKLDLMKMGEQYKYSVGLAVLKGDLTKKKTTGQDSSPVPIEDPGAAAPINTLNYLHGKLSRRMNTASSLIDKANGELYLRLQNDIGEQDNPDVVKSAGGFLEQIFTTQVVKELNEKRSTTLSDSPTYQRNKDKIYNKAKALIDNIESSHQGTKSQFASYTDDINNNIQLAGRYAQNIRKNDKAVLNQLIVEHYNDRDQIRSIFDEEEYHMSRRNYVNKYGENNAERVYDKWFPKYLEMNNLSATNNRKPVVTIDLPGNSGGIQKPGAVIHMDPINGPTPYYQAMEESIRNIDAPGFLGFVEGSQPIAANNVITSEQSSYKGLYNIAKAFYDEYSHDLKKGKGEIKTRGDIIPHPVAMNNMGVSGITIKPSEEWLQQYKGSKTDTKALAKDIEKAREGFTLLFEADKAPSFFDNYNPSVVSSLLQYGQSVPIRGYEDWGGQITLVPNSTGSFNITGWVWEINEKTGKKEKNTNVSSVGTDLSSDPDTQMRMIKADLAERSRYNYARYDHPSNPSTKGDIMSTDQLIKMMEGQYQPGPNANQSEE